MPNAEINTPAIVIAVFIMGMLLLTVDSCKESRRIQYRPVNKQEAIEIGREVFEEQIGNVSLIEKDLIVRNIDGTFKQYVAYYRQTAPDGKSVIAKFVSQ